MSEVKPCEHKRIELFPSGVWRCFFCLTEFIPRTPDPDLEEALLLLNEINRYPDSVSTRLRVNSFLTRRKGDNQTTEGELQ